MNFPDFGLTGRDEAFLLLGELDLEAQLLAVRSLLRRNAQADTQLAQEIDELAKRAEDASGEYPAQPGSASERCRYRRP